MPSRCLPDPAEEIPVVPAKRVCVALAAGALTLWSASGFLTAQSEKSQDPQQPPRFRTEASFVRVDVYPVKNGMPMAGLTKEDFELLEDNVVQKIDTFEHIVVRPADSSARIDPGSQRDMLQAVSNPRNRVFVIFLDTPHVSVPSAHTINEPLIELIDRILGPDDLVGIMTPEMAATQVVFARKTQVIEESLRKNWAWGSRFTTLRDERETAYENCYPLLSKEQGQSSDLVKRLIARKRERASLEAMQDLVRYLRTLREERKAILTVTEGWLLYGEDRSLMKLREDPQLRWQEPVPGNDPITVGPNGKLTTKDPRQRSTGTLSKTECDADRLQLAMLDNKRFFRDLMGEANHANASFYPIDPRGLAAFDNPIGPEAPPPPVVDQAMLTTRLESMRTLALNTDGLAVVSSNNLRESLKRISDDLTSYYLLGYYSTNSRLDGRYRTLKVRVRQPGVDVRARPGYRAATADEVAAARNAADPPVPEATRAVLAAIDKLGSTRSAARFRLNGAAFVGATSTMWIAGELESSGGRPDAFAEGGTAEIEATFGVTSTTANATLKPGERTFLVSMAVPEGAVGDVIVRARLTPLDKSAVALTDGIKLPVGESTIQPLYFRRGPTTGNRVLPAADLRFSRTDRLRIELPVGAEVKAGAGRLLDRAGQPLQVPVTLSERVDQASGQRWIVADVVLGPLAQGDFGVEIGLVGAKSQNVVTAIRVVR
jgi:VWFA-related protein